MLIQAKKKPACAGFCVLIVYQQINRILCLIDGFFVCNEDLEIKVNADNRRTRLVATSAIRTA